MRAEQIRSYLRAAPFRPFRAFLSDGTVLEVPHPEFAFVATHHFIVALDASPSGLPRRTVMCDPLHVTHIEVAEQDPPAAPPDPARPDDA